MKGVRSQSGNPRIDASLRKRVRAFYAALADGDWDRCYRFVDPVLRGGEHALDPETYALGLRNFLEYHGEVRVHFVEIKPHPGVSARMYDGREFATVWVVWTDKARKLREFRWPWIKDGRSWYTRCVGLSSPRQESEAI